MHPASRFLALTVTSIAASALIGACGNGTTTDAPAPPSQAAPADQAPAPTLDAWFHEEAAPRGVIARHRSGHRDRYFMPESTVGGAAMLDMDGDGFLDLYLVQSGSLIDTGEEQPRNQLYRNRGDGTFEDVSGGSGADDSGYGCGVATGDYDNDGDVDLYVTNVGPNVLLRNDGGDRFTDVTTAAGVGHAGFGTSAVFVDYDSDGDLDLFALNYLVWTVEMERECRNELGELEYCHPGAYNAPAMDVLYRNNGDGTFTDATLDAGMSAAFGTGLGLACGDFSGDGLIDIFVANDGIKDQLWVNLGDGRFEERGMLAGCAIDLAGQAKAGMGVTVNDIDDDGDLDLMVCNLVRESDSYFVNNGGFFVDATAAAGLAGRSRMYTRFGMAWVDFDNDGYLDLYQANGRVARQSFAFSADDPYAEPNLLMSGTPGGRFSEVEPMGGTVEACVATSRAAVFGDIDNDGGIDILVVNRDGPAHLLHNLAGQRGHWIMFRVVDEHHRDAVGATLRVRVGPRTLHRDVRSAYSYCAANDPRVHIGLGEQRSVDEVVVRWPDGSLERFGPFESDRIVELKCGSGEPHSQ